MKLKVNMEKTEARRAVGSSFLGFVFTTIKSKNGLGHCRPKQKKIEKFEQRIKEITKRSRGVSAERMITELNSYLRGWINYYARLLRKGIHQDMAWRKGPVDKAEGTAVPVEAMEESGCEKETPAGAWSTRMVDKKIPEGTLEQQALADGSMPWQRVTQ